MLGSRVRLPGHGRRAVTGTWTLIDAQRRVVARGGWSAAQSPSAWTGSWRAVAIGRPGEYAGTWTAGRETGIWTIRAFT